LVSGLFPTSNVLESKSSNYVSVKEVVVVVVVVMVGLLLLLLLLLLLGNICTVGPVRKSGYQSPEDL
jgi:uncharacterized integral membrane protein